MKKKFVYQFTSLLSSSTDRLQQFLCHSKCLTTTEVLTEVATTVGEAAVEGMAATTTATTAMAVETVTGEIVMAEEAALADMENKSKSKLFCVTSQYF